MLTLADRDALATTALAVVDDLTNSGFRRKTPANLDSDSRLIPT
jgi:hypothetical protein